MEFNLSLATSNRLQGLGLSLDKLISKLALYNLVLFF